jgi:hypothetical protein
VLAKESSDSYMLWFFGRLGDPVKINVAPESAGKSAASGTVVKVMKGEIERLTNELEITTAQKVYTLPSFVPAALLSACAGNFRG